MIDREHDLSIIRQADILKISRGSVHYLPRRHVKTLMRWTGIEALYRRSRTTKPEPRHRIHPYLRRDLEITRPNRVWATDITYIPMAHGFVHLAAVLD